MKSSSEKAVIIIGVLSLFLGFSLGQNHRQHLKLKRLEAASVFGVHDPPHRHAHPWKCDAHHERLQRKVEQLRLSLEQKRMRLEEQRRVMEESYLRALEEQERRQLRLEFKDAESGADAVLRIVREE